MMTDTTDFLEVVPLQDRDLLQRLSAYFDGLDSRIRQGQGWFIFNADGSRSVRITSFIRRQIGAHQPGLDAYVMPWSDFALSAYLLNEGLLQVASGLSDADPTVKREYELALRVTSDTRGKLDSSDMLVLVGLKPSRPAEAELLDKTIEARYQRRLPTIILTPDLPQTLQAEFQAVDPTLTYWERFFQRMYETSYVAL